MSDAVTKWIVHGTFALLLFASVLTWTLVLVKARQRWSIWARDRRFLRAAGAPLKLAVLRTLEQRENQRGPAWRLAQAGLGALAEAGPLGESQGAAQSESNARAREAVERALTVQLAQERRASEAGLAVLASIGTTAPFVGLFGTVFGIISALKAIGSSGSASLEVVAAPIGEALVATGVGIAVAVPAVLAYNFFVRKLKLQVSDLEQFGAGFLGAVARGIDHAELRLERSGLDRPREGAV
jgi:biopolymer transport protein ExbB